MALLSNNVVYLQNFIIQFLFKQMTRENAIKFLRDIRMGIEYLQSSYDNRPLTYNVKGKPLDMVCKTKPFIQSHYLTNLFYLQI